ncbi:YafY family protein [Conexibacter sp. JD483]|uniref:helix-turn-helix transcriptional regulator n=1 Tax=unclassified Conexibacter TaxID=2627773 RepID=UPI00271CF594|nr:MULTISPECIES: YafY family protein [unclassified Conexibacter]MDO8189366.1 YafY family protein [Conexibacter sp. CPCC 205706]MDO8197357.1 YafY family protein [Conexibacter sp. CPCC 205762]MDR9372545.1 YafY family protein [Conexibacter sp. JD483]
MKETSARLLRLLSLLQLRREWAGAELADRLGVTPRTIRRDVDKLRDLGYPIDATRGVAGGYRLGAGGELPPLLLDDEEAVAVAIGLRTASGGAVTGIEESSLRALAKLEQVLPSHLRRRVTALSRFTAALPRSGPSVDHELLSTIAAAARDSERLRFGYRTYTGDDARRLVEPCRLVHISGIWYLVAWDVERDDWRTFRVDRIDGRPSLDRRFSPREPPAADVAEYVRRNVVRARGRKQARVLLRMPLAQARERVPQLEASLTAVDAGSCLLTTGSEWYGGLAIYVAALRCEFEVLEPPEFVAEIERLAGAFGRAAAQGPIRSRREGGERGGSDP